MAFPRRNTEVPMKMCAHPCPQRTGARRPVNVDRRTRPRGIGPRMARRVL